MGKEGEEGGRRKGEGEGKRRRVAALLFFFFFFFFFCVASVEGREGSDVKKKEIRSKRAAWRLGRVTMAGHGVVMMSMMMMMMMVVDDDGRWWMMDDDDDDGLNQKTGEEAAGSSCIHWKGGVAG